MVSELAPEGELARMRLRKFISTDEVRFYGFLNHKKPMTKYLFIPSWAFSWFFTLFCGIKIITYKIGIEKEHHLLQNVSCLKLRTEVE